MNTLFALVIAVSAWVGGVRERWSGPAVDASTLPASRPHLSVNGPAAGAGVPAHGSPIVPTAHLADVAAKAVHAVQAEHPDFNLKDDDISVTVVDLRDPKHVVGGDFRGEARHYPASVVKLFYLAATHRWLEDGKFMDSAELRRGLHDMIVDSDNAACGYILDCLTEAPNGHDLPPAEMEKWVYRRNAVNRFYAGLGYANINVNQKTYIDGPYGLDRIVLGPHYENSNKLTTNATARLLTEIMLDRFVSAERCRQMKELLKRDMTKPSKGPDDQAHGFTALALPPDYELYSKAGWTSTARHDAAYVASPDGKLKFIVVTFTTGHAKQREIIPGVAKSVMEQLSGGAEKR
jgi:beta-lactamase class A